ASSPNSRAARDGATRSVPQLLRGRIRDRDRLSAGRRLSPAARLMPLDAHQHFWRYDAERDAWITSDMGAIRRDFLPVDLVAELGANGIDGCIAVQADQSAEETRFLLDLAHAHSFIRGVVGWVDLRSTDLDATLESLATDP